MFKASVSLAKGDNCNTNNVEAGFMLSDNSALLRGDQGDGFEPPLRAINDFDYPAALTAIVNGADAAQLQLD